MTLRLYQAGLQIVTKNETAKYDLYQTGLQVVIRRKNPVYGLYQTGLQVALRRLDMPQHAQYSIYDLPLEVVYEPAMETIQFSHCLEAGYFFSVDHFAELHDGDTLTVKVYGGVPPYTWSLDVGSALSLSDTETDVPYATLSITGTFAVGTEELTVEDACGSQATVCIYLCDEYTSSSYTCTTEFSCDEHCRRTVVPIEPEPPPLPPLPPIPPPPPGPPSVPETEVYTAQALTTLLNLNLLIVSFWNDPDNTEVRLLWDLDTMAPLSSSIGPAFVTLEEYNAFYSFLDEISWIEDLLVEGGSAALPTKNWQKYPATNNFNIEDFGYLVTQNYEWGCGNTFTRADFVPLWCEDSETICFGRCGGVNWGDDFYDECRIMPPWDSAELLVDGRAVQSGYCESRTNHTWPDDGGPDWVTWYEQKFTAVQGLDAHLYFNIHWLNCPPWSYAKLHDSDIEVYHTIENVSIHAIDLALGANEGHNYAREILYTDPGNWGSISLVPASEAAFDVDPSFIRTSLRYSGTYFAEGNDPWEGPENCTNFAPGALGEDLIVIHEELMYEYFTHWNRIGIFYPYLGLRRGEETGHRKIKIVANEELQCQIYLFQRSETITYIGDKTQREGTFHAALENGEIKHFAPKLLPRREAFEKALDALFSMYYIENDYDSGTDLSSKIDPNLQIRVGTASVSSSIKFFELPLEVVYERS